MEKIRRFSKNSLIKYLLIATIFLCFSLMFLRFFRTHLSLNSIDTPIKIQESHVLSLFFRDLPWAFPMQIHGHFSTKIPLGLLDIIPIMAIICKLLRIQSLSYFGIWLVVSYLLSFLFAYQIGSKVFENWGGIWGILLFASMPVFWYHPMFLPWFSGQWLILWSISLFLRKKPCFSFQWYPIIFLGTMVHPYFVIVCFLLLISDFFRVYTENYNISSQVIASQLSHLFSLVICSFTLIGLFYLPSFRVDSSNISPLQFKISPSLLNTYVDSYLKIGLGLILACIIALIFLFFTLKENDDFRFPLPLSLFIGVLLFLSTSGGLMLNTKIYRYYKFHSWISLYLAPIFTSGPRYFIPILYLIPSFLLYSAHKMEKMKRFTGFFFLSSCLILQFAVFDLPSIGKNSYLSNSKELEEFMLGSKKIYWIYPKEIAFSPAEFHFFGNYAFRNNIHLNASPVIRFPTHYKKTLEKHALEFKKQFFDKNTIYIIEKHEIDFKLEEFGDTMYTSDLVIFKAN